MSQQNNSIKLIVGLGNPGPQYESTRHNAGAWFVEALARDYRVDMKVEPKFHGRCGRIQTSDIDAWLIIPDTFMNLSGRAVFALSNFYKIPLENILVAHDELDLDPGVARLKFGGGHGGHNGLRDIIQKFGGKKEFHRLRIGIGHPGNRGEVHNWVLGKAPKSEQEKIDLAIDESLFVTRQIVNGDMAKAMNQLHQFKAG